MEFAKVLEEHRFLERLLGVWTVTTQGVNQQWTENVRSLHGIWYVAEGNGEMPDGGGATSVLTLGYSASKRKYVGTWIGSMMDHIWVYEGEVSADGKVLRLNTRGPDCQTDAEYDYQEEITFIDEDHRTFTSSARQADGSWKQFMEAHYVRKP